MLHPLMDEEEKGCLIQFRPSMKKFSTDISQTFSVVDYSKPYAFGRLNNDIIVLLSSLGITNEKLLSKQEAYFQWIAEASQNLTHAIDFLSCLGENALVEDVLLKGLDDRDVSHRVLSLQLKEIAMFRKNDKPRSRMIIINLGSSLASAILSASSVKEKCLFALQLDVEEQQPPSTEMPLNKVGG